MALTQKQKTQGQNDPEAGKNFYLKSSIKGIDVEPYCTVLNLIVREWVFDILPRIEMEILDNGRFTDQYPLEDLDEIQIELNNIRSKEPVVNATFQLNDYDIRYTGIGDDDLQYTIIRLTGFLKNTDIFFPIYNRIFSKKNSKDVFSQIISPNSDLKFSNRINPRDNMNWIQQNQSNVNFIKHVLERSYLRENDIQFLYTDRNSNCIYTSLNTEIEKNNKTKNYVYTKGANLLTSSNLSNKDLQERIKVEQEENPNTNYFFNYQFKNVAGTLNKTSSYGVSFNYFDIQENESSIFGKNISDLKKLTKNTLKNKDNIGKITKHINHGFLDSSNVHKNYIEAQIQNEYIKNNFFGSYLIIYARPDNELNLFDVVDVKVPANLKIDDSINDVHSGKYIVGGIIHHVETKRLFDDIIILFRNGTNINGFIKEGNVKNS